MDSIRKVLTDEELVMQSYYVRGYKNLGSRIIVNDDLKDIYYCNFCSSAENVISSIRKVFDKHYQLHMKIVVV